MANKNLDPKILIVEDDPVAFAHLEKSLESLGYKGNKAVSVDDAMHLFQVNTFDVVITEIKLPDTSGLNLLKWIKENQKIPVVLMSADKETIDSINFIQLELGADGFLEKPVNEDELFRILRICLPASNLPDVNESSVDQN